MREGLWYVQRSHAPWKVLDFLIKFLGPGKSWNILSYDVGSGHNEAGADAKISSDFICIYEKNRWRPGLCPAPDPIVTAVRTTRSWKMLLGSWKFL